MGFDFYQRFAIKNNLTTLSYEIKIVQIGARWSDGDQSCDR